MAFSVDNPDYRIGYIVMEYIEAPDCDEGDVQLVAGAVQTLISIPVRTLCLDPSVEDPLYIPESSGRLRSLTTLEELQRHVNGVSEH